MKDPLEVLRQKETELQRLQEEVEALRRVGKMLKENLPVRAQQSGRGKILQMPEAPVNPA
jgi:hypothetical protein